MNRIVVTGNLARDPEMRETAAGEKMCNFSIAVQRKFAKEDGTREADFLSVVTWRALAENVMKYVKKGDKVGVSGRIQVRSWQNQEGVKKYVTEIVADEVEFLFPKKQEETEEDYQVQEPARNTFQGRQKSMFDTKKPIEELEPVADDDLPF